MKRAIRKLLDERSNPMFIGGANGEGRTPMTLRPPDPKSDIEVHGSAEHQQKQGAKDSPGQGNAPTVPVSRHNIRHNGFSFEKLTGRDFGPLFPAGDLMDKLPKQDEEAVWNSVVNTNILALANLSSIVLVPISDGRLFAAIDRQDIELVNSLKWKVQLSHGHAYAIAASGRNLGMHRLIMDAQPGQHIDHRDGYGLNNTRANLRMATFAQNRWNSIKRTLRSPTSSRYKGVWFCNGYWRSQIVVNGKRMDLGNFSLEHDAAVAYDAASFKYHGEFARFNFPQDYA